MNRIETPNLTLISPVSAARHLIYDALEDHMAEHDQNTGRDLTWDEVRRAIERAARSAEARRR